MAEIINLRQARKQKARVEAEKTAEQNRISFGRTKAERTLDDRRKDRASDLLNQHKLDDGDAS